MFTDGMTDIDADGVGSETLALRKELGSWSDVGGGCKMLEQGYGEAWVTSMFQGYGMTDIEADGVGLRETMRLWIQDYSEARVISKVMVEFVKQVRTRTLKLMATLESLAFRKEVGSWSDVTKECEIQFQDYRKNCGIHGDFGVSGHRSALLLVLQNRKDIEADGVGSETLALRKELGSWSDVTGARCWNRVMSTLALRKELGSWSDVTECKMLEQVTGGMQDATVWCKSCQTTGQG
ncbi:Bromodomain-Containing Protein 9 [Manis pentadactyla]|nr:Bromodomain-Containing Protein 9 [Manis pentadactyla]